MIRWKLEIGFKQWGLIFCADPGDIGIYYIDHALAHTKTLDAEFKKVT
jgi:hypothetical protein